MGFFNNEYFSNEAFGEESCYFTSYFDDYFSVCDEAPAEVVTRVVGGYQPTKEEWEYYLKIWHNRRRERLAMRAAERGLRAELRESLFPRPPPKPARVKPVTTQVTEPRSETRLPAPQTDPQIELRLRIAQLLIDLRKRTKAAKKKRRKKRDEEALMALLH